MKTKKHGKIFFSEIRGLKNSLKEFSYSHSTRCSFEENKTDFLGEVNNSPAGYAEFLAISYSPNKNKNTLHLTYKLKNNFYKTIILMYDIEYTKYEEGKNKSAPNPFILYETYREDINALETTLDVSKNVLLVGNAKASSPKEMKPLRKVVKEYEIAFFEPVKNYWLWR